MKKTNNLQQPLPACQTDVIRCIVFFCAWAINKFINYEIRLNNKQS